MKEGKGVGGLRPGGVDRCVYLDYYMTDIGVIATCSFDVGVEHRVTRTSSTFRHPVPPVRRVPAWRNSQLAAQINLNHRPLPFLLHNNIVLIFHNNGVWKRYVTSFGISIHDSFPSQSPNRRFER